MDSTIVGVKRNPPCRTLILIVESELKRRSRTLGMTASPGDPGVAHRHLEGRNRQMATETARSDLPADVTEHLTTEDRSGLLRAMLMMRGIEERAMTLYRQGKVPGSFYDGFGQEAVSAGATWAMAADDRLCILHRDLAAHIIRGVEPWRIFAQYMGRQDGITRGRDGNVHFGDRTKGCVGMVSMLPDMMLVATGLAMAFKMRGEQRVALTWFGDGSTSRGDFHEAMNWAGVQRLPVIVILENNQYAYSTPLDQQFAVDPVERAAAYGFPGVKVDGNDPEATFEATRVARERALAGEGPTLIEAVTMRMHGHAAHDDMKYVPKEQVEEWRAKDPIDRQVRRVEALGVDVAALRDEIKAEIEAAVEAALQMPMPDGETATHDLFADEPALLEDGNAPWSGFNERSDDEAAGQGRAS
jgi:TPP-dependent pyruvate/acetoin dehydrogenase alpha subunit